MRTHFLCSIISSGEVSDQITPASFTGIHEIRKDTHKTTSEITELDTMVDARSLANTIFTENKVE